MEVPMRKLVTALALIGTIAFTACGSNGSTGGVVPTINPGTQTSTPPPPAWTLPLMQQAYQPKVDSTQFTDTITNPYFPMTPGTVTVFEGTRDGKPLHIEVTVTTDTKVIMGVRCIVVRDIVTGALEERTSDWYAQDKAGNVWYFGEDTKEYTNGVVTSTAGSWEAGVDGALPGIIMQANPAQGQAYRQEYRPTVAEDVAMVKNVSATAQLPSGKSYTNVLVTNDRDLLDTTKDEDKFFAPGIGLVKLTGLVNGHREEVWLTSVLTPK
jgi:hypothetical protein